MLFIFDHKSHIWSARALRWVFRSKLAVLKYLWMYESILVDNSGMFKRVLIRCPNCNYNIAHKIISPAVAKIIFSVLTKPSWVWWNSTRTWVQPAPLCSRAQNFSSSHMYFKTQIEPVVTPKCGQIFVDKAIYWSAISTSSLLSYLWKSDWFFYLVLQSGRLHAILG